MAGYIQIFTIDDETGFVNPHRYWRRRQCKTQRSEILFRSSTHKGGKLRQQLLKKTSDLLFSVDKMNLKYPVPFHPVGIGRKHVVVIVRMNIQVIVARI